MANALIQDLDDFSEYVNTKNFTEERCKEIIQAIDIVENAIEETAY